MCPDHDLLLNVGWTARSLNRFHVQNSDAIVRDPLLDLLWVK